MIQFIIPIIKALAINAGSKYVLKKVTKAVTRKGLKTKSKVVKDKSNKDEKH